MALSIKDPKADRLAREVARRTGDTITGAITRALEERLARVREQTGKKTLREELNEIAARCAALPTLDQRSEDEILGYDAKGIPLPPSAT